MASTQMCYTTSVQERRDTDVPPGTSGLQTRRGAPYESMYRYLYYPLGGLVPLMVPLRPSLLLDDKVGEHSEYGVTGFRYITPAPR